MRWQEFKKEVKRDSKLHKLERQSFDSFLRKAVNLSAQKHYYHPNRVGEGYIIDSPAGKVSKLKAMTQKEFR